jgi:hypothetical protein
MLGVAYRIKEFLLLVLATFLIVVQFRPSFFFALFPSFYFCAKFNFFPSCRYQTPAGVDINGYGVQPDLRKPLGSSWLGGKPKM